MWLQFSILWDLTQIEAALRKSFDVLYTKGTRKKKRWGKWENSALLVFFCFAILLHLSELKVMHPYTIIMRQRQENCKNALNYITTEIIFPMNWIVSSMPKYHAKLFFDWYSIHLLKSDTILMINSTIIRSFLCMLLKNCTLYFQIVITPLILCYLLYERPSDR